MAHSLRHPSIVLYMGLSLDPVKNNAHIVHEYVSKATLFEIIHGVVPRRLQSSKRRKREHGFVDSSAVTDDDSDDSVEKNIKYRKTST